MNEYQANHGNGEVTANWSWHQAKGKGKMHDLIEAQRLPWDDEIERQAKGGVDRIEFLVQARTLPKKKPKMCSEQAKLRAEKKARLKAERDAASLKGRLESRFRVTTRRGVEASAGVPGGTAKASAKASAGVARGDAEGVLAACADLLKVVKGVVDDVQYLRQTWVIALARGGTLEKETFDQKGLLFFRVRMPDGTILARGR